MENHEKVDELFNQDGILLQTGPASHIDYIKCTGTIYIVQYESSENIRLSLEWKPNDLTIVSEVQDQEWAVVNTIEGRTRTLSGNLLPEEITRSKYLRMNFDDIKSFKVSSNKRSLTFFDGKGESLCCFQFQNGDSTCLIVALKQHLKVMPAKRDKNLYVVAGLLGDEDRQLEKSFKTLSIHQDDSRPYMWNLISNFQQKPYETTMEAFAKLSDIGKIFKVFLIKYFKIIDRCYQFNVVDSSLVAMHP